MIKAHVLAAQARARYNKAQFRQNFALADAGRVMAQGFCARLAEGVCRLAVADQGA